MKLEKVKHRLDVKNSDLSGSVFDDVNMAGLTVEGMTIDGIAVTDLFAAHRERSKPASDGGPITP